MKKSSKPKILTLEELIRLSTEQKTFQFKKSNFNFNYTKLAAEGVITEQQETVSIPAGEKFTSALFIALAHEMNFKPSKDFAATIDFLQQVEDYYRETNNRVIGITGQVNSMLKFLLVKSNLEYGAEFEEVAVKFKSEDNVLLLRQFNAIFFEVLPALNISIKKVVELSEFLIPKMTSNVYHNASLSQIGNGIEKHSRTQENIADQYLSICYSNPKIPTLIFAASIAGKYHSTGNNSGFLTTIVKEDKYHLAFVTAVSAFDVQNEKQALEIMDIVDSVKPKTDELLMGLPLLYARLIANNKLAGTKVTERSFAALQALIVQPNKVLKQVVLQNLRLVEDHDDEINKLIYTLDAEITDADLLDGLSQVLAGRKLPNCFFDFVIAHASYGKKFPVNAFDYPIHHFLAETPIEFSTGLIGLLIHDEGVIRLAGGKILKSVSQSREQFNFAIDLLTLPPLDQYKLWVSVLHMDYDIERALPMVLAIRKSNSVFVADVFKLKLEYEINNYGIPVIEILEKYADQNDPEDQKLIARLKKRNEQITERLNQKSFIRELNPYYTQSKLMKEFDEIWRAKFNSSIQKNVDKGSIIRQLATTVILAKGGGWKHEDEINGEIGKLTKIETSMSLPRQHSISPNKYDYEIRTWYTEDWTKDFKTWEATI